LAHLQVAGHKASHALDSFPQGAPDGKLFAHAQEQNAIFVTTDKDFFHTIPLSFARIMAPSLSHCANQIAPICFAA
jgi:predicted nuclease of predicted toxin-antitoxin system